MSKINPLSKNSDLNSQMVAEYLSQHPDFFTHHPELLTTLALPPFEPELELGVTSLTHKQMSGLRSRIADLEEEITALLGIASKNERTFADLMKLQESLLSARHLDEMLSLLQSFAASVQMSAHLKILQPNALELPESCQITQLCYQRVMQRLISDKNAYLGRLNKQDAQELFGLNMQTTQTLGSCVILPLNSENFAGLLSFYNPNASHFGPSMDTLFLEQLTRLTAYVLEHLLASQNKIGLPAQRVSSMSGVQSL